jgi:DNA polymerase elongation subunit (family B)
MLIRGWDDARGGHFMEKVKFNPTLYVTSKKDTGYKTLDGQNVSPVTPGNIKDCRDFIEEYNGVSGVTVYGQERFLYQYLAEEYPEPIEYDQDKIKLWSLDIETTSENGFPKPEEAREEVLLISLKNFRTKNIITFGSRPYNNTNPQVNYVECHSEFELLNTFIGWWSEVKPEVITGWNVDLFDITYLCNRIGNVMGPQYIREMSPWGMYNKKDLELNGRLHQKYEIHGITIIDYLDIYKKFTYTNRESYRLDVIAEIELGQKKLDHSEFDTFKDFYTNDWQKFVDYNIHDVNLVDQLEERMKLIDLVMLMSYDAKVNYIDTFSQVRLWDVIIYNYLRERNIVLPLMERSEKNDQYAGAYVKEPLAGSYDWVVSYDLNSLYPSLIRFLNISPETLLPDRLQLDVDKLIQKEEDIFTPDDVCVGANGALFSKEQTGIMPELVKTIYDERVQYKRNMLRCKQQYEDNPSEDLAKQISKWSNFQMARKIQLNSLYGALGNQYFRHYKLENAEAITLTGQVAIRWIERKLNEYINTTLSTTDVDYVIASDTDSIYLNLGPLVSLVFGDKTDDRERIVNVLNQFSEDKIVPFIDESYEELSEYLQCYEKTLVMKRECIAEKGIWTAKKRYILNVWDNEGVRYKEPKLKMMGIEAVRSSTPAPCRKYIKDTLKIIMEGTEDDLIDYIETSRKEFKLLEPETVGFPRSANNVHKFMDSTTMFKKGTPMHIRAAIMFNHYVKEYNLTKKYNLIATGEKIKYIHLKTPNPTGQNVIGMISEFPKEFNLTDYIDYDTMFDKSFLEPLKVILDIIGWKTEHTSTLDSFFV